MPARVSPSAVPGFTVCPRCVRQSHPITRLMSRARIRPLCSLLQNQQHASTPSHGTPNMAENSFKFNREIFNLLIISISYNFHFPPVGSNSAPDVSVQFPHPGRWPGFDVATAGRPVKLLRSERRVVSPGGEKKEKRTRQHALSLSLSLSLSVVVVQRDRLKWVWDFFLSYF